MLTPIQSPRGFTILPVHYTHDPEKTQEWLDRERPKYDQAAWDRDYEIDFRSQLGKPCYPAFGIHHVVRDLVVEPFAPIDLCMDFNFTPMSWLISQVQQGWESAIEEISQDSSSIELAVEEFRNRYPAHRAGVRVYGDASGKNSDGHVGKSYYQLFQLAMRGYPGPVSYRVPLANPPQRDRVSAVNLKLAAPDGVHGVRISTKCPELLQDYGEVVWSKDGKKILEDSDPKNPYSRRGHMSAAHGYKIAREWPVAREVSKALQRPIKRKPRNPAFAAMGRAD